MFLRKFLAFTVCLILCAIAMTGCSSAPAGNGNSSASQAPAAEPTAEPVASHPDNYLKASIKNIFNDKEYRRDRLQAVTFLDTLDGMPADAWDISARRDGSVMTWVTEDVNLYIAGNGGVTATSCEELFGDCSSLTAINFNDCFYTDGVENFSGMFKNCSKLTSLDVSALDTSSATDMSAMFGGCMALTALDLTSLDTALVTDMSEMFAYCVKLADLNLAGLNTSSVTDMTEMFYCCGGLTAIDLSGFDTANVTTMKAMFENCGFVTSINVSSFNTSNVTDFSRMFLSCADLSDLNLSGFDFGSGKDFSHMFMWCENLSGIGCTITVPADAAAEKMYTNSPLG